MGKRRLWRLAQQLLLLWLLPAGLLLACGGDRAEPTATPLPTVAVTLQPTFTPTPGGVARASTTLSITRTPSAVLSSPTATPLPTATLPVAEHLALAHYQYRIGDYAAARTSLTALLQRGALPITTAADARYLLARTYLAEGAYTEANTALQLLLADREALGAAAPSPTTSAVLTATAALSATSVQTFAQAAANSTITTPLTATWPADNVVAKADFLQAVALNGLGEYNQSIAAYWRFLEAYPGMVEFVQPRIAAAYLAMGNSSGAADAYRRAADATTDRVAKARLLEVLGGIYSDAHNFTAAVATYDEILALAQNAGYRAEIQYRAGQALSAAGDTPGAIARWRAATEEAPASGSAYLALVELVNRNVAFDLYQRGYIDLQADALQPAINAFQSYIDSVSATDSRVGAAWAGIGQAYLKAGNYTAAIDALNQVIANYQSCPCFGQAWLDKAAAQAAHGAAVEAQRTYRTFARTYPDDALAPEALWRSGLQALNGDNRVEAAADLLRLADSFPASERAPFALYIVGFGAYQAGLYAQSITLYERLQNDYPEYNWPGVAFWLGRAHQAHGDSAEAVASWQALVDKAPDIYYGILAAQSLKKLPLVSGNWLNAMSAIAGPATTLADDDGSQTFAEGWLAAWLDLDPTTLPTLPPPVATDPDLRMGALLLELDERGDGLAALARVYERYKDDPHALYALSLRFEELGAYRLSIICMSRLMEFSPAQLVEDAPIFLQKRAFPQPFADLITQEALAHQINPLLYFSLIRQESLFEEGARSSAAAQGLAQIIPDTGQWVADRLGHPEYTNEIIYRPHINLQFGAYYLAWTRDYLDGNIISALVGYNAGPGNAQAWRAIVGADDTLFVELLTVNEPRIYVQTITTNLYHYTRLYGGG
jgi:soluble lytic murein transglycosylase